MVIRIDGHKATLLIPEITQAELEAKVQWADYKMHVPYTEFAEWKPQTVSSEPVRLQEAS